MCQQEGLEDSKSGGRKNNERIITITRLVVMEVWTSLGRPGTLSRKEGHFAKVLWGPSKGAVRQMGYGR